MFARKALEGLGVSAGELEDAADAVGWLALHGIDAIPSFHDLLRNLDQAPLQPINESTLDGTNQSCMLIGPPALDYAYAKATHNGQFTLTLRNCRHPLSLIAHMIRCAQRGVHLAAQWPQNQVAICSGESTPTLIQWVADGDKAMVPICSRQPADVTLILATDAPIDLSKLALPHTPRSSRREYTPAHFAAQRQHHIESGIQVDATLWANIEEIGKLVLVEATEESRRRGAGEAASGS